MWRNYFECVFGIFGWCEFTNSGFGLILWGVWMG